MSSENVETSNEAAPVEAVLVTNNDVKALVGSRYFKATLKGLQFNVDEAGKLVTIPLSAIEEGVGSLKLFGQAHTWWAGDMGCLIKDLYGDEKLVWFFEQVGLDPTRGKQLMSISRSYGFPDKITEYRHPDPKVSWQHHNIAQGIKDRGQRRKLLNDASEVGMTVKTFYEHVNKFKAGPGAGPDDEPEYGVFRTQYRAYDPKTDNPEQFLQGYFDHVKTVEFPEYLDPARKDERLEQEKRESLADKLPAELKSKILLEHGSLEFAKFEELVNKLLEGTKEVKKIETHLGKIKDEAIRTQLSERVKAENITSFETYKEIASKVTKEAKQRKSEKDKIDKLIAKIKDADKRHEIFELVAKEGLFLVQVEPLVKEILTEEMIQEESARLISENEDRIKKRADQIREKQLAPKEEKKKSKAPDLPLGKDVKKTSKKASKSSETAPPAGD